MTKSVVSTCECMVGGANVIPKWEHNRVRLIYLLKILLNELEGECSSGDISKAVTNEIKELFDSF